MKKKIFALFLIAMIGLSVIEFPVTEASAADWTGYTKISKPEDLLLMKNSSEKFYLTKDINMKDYGNWTPIIFYGTFNGNGYAIKNLVSTSGGLFERLSGDVTIKNLGLSNVTISSNSDYVGALANSAIPDNGGDSRYSLIIENCYVTGKVVCTYEKGYAAGFIGMIGYYYSSGNIAIKNCYNKASVTSNYSTAGIFGVTLNSWYGSLIITNCINSGTIAGNSEYIGGIAGYINDANITSCYNYGTVKSTNADVVYKVGGLVGKATSKTYMTDCATTGKTDIAYKGDGCLAEGKTGVSKDDFKLESTYKGLDFKKTWTINTDANSGYPILQSMLKLYNLSSDETATGFELTINIKKGDILQLGAILTPSDTTSTITWKSDKTSIASVSNNGKVTAKAKGTATITATAGKIEQMIKIVVNE